MDQDNNPHNSNPNGEPSPLPGIGGGPPPPPAYSDPEPPRYGDPVTPQPAGPPPTPPPPGLDPGPASAPPPPYYGPAGGTTTTTTGSLTNPSKDERNWGMFAHLSALLVGLLSSAVGFPIFSFLGPLVIYLMKKDESPFIADQAKEALNFNISIGIIMFVLLILTFTVILAILTIPLMIIIGLAALILSIIAAIKASNGEVYRYPFTIRLIN